MRTTLTLASIAAALALSAYLLRLAVRTVFFARTAAVGTDVAVFVGILCVVALLCSFIAVRLQAEPRWLPLVALTVNGLLSLAYLLLYVFGKFGPVQPKV